MPGSPVGEKRTSEKDQAAGSGLLGFVQCSANTLKPGHVFCRECGLLRRSLIRHWVGLSTLSLARRAVVLSLAMCAGDLEILEIARIKSLQLPNRRSCKSGGMQTTAKHSEREQSRSEHAHAW